MKTVMSHEFRRVGVGVLPRAAALLLLYSTFTCVRFLLVHVNRLYFQKKIASLSVLGELFILKSIIF